MRDVYCAFAGDVKILNFFSGRGRKEISISQLIQSRKLLHIYIFFWGRGDFPPVFFPRKKMDFFLLEILHLYFFAWHAVVLTNMQKKIKIQGKKMFFC